MRYLAFATAILSTSSFVSAADPALLNLVMPEAQVVAGVNLAKAKTSPFGQFVLRQMPENGDFAKFITTSGFDPRRDLQEVLMVTVASHKYGLVAARGTFDAAKISALIVADGKYKLSAYSGAQLFLPLDSKTAQVLALFDGSFALVGDVDSVRAALDRRKTQNALNPVLASKIAMYGATDAWTVSVAPLAPSSGITTDQPSGPLNGILQSDLLKKVSETSGGVTFTSPVQVTAELIADTDKDATALGDVIRLLATMVQTNGGEAGASVATLVQTLNISTNGKKLNLALAIPEAQLEALIQFTGTKHSDKKRSIEKI